MKSLSDVPQTAVLPCPFCGSPAELRHDTSSDYSSHWDYSVQCMDPRWWKGGTTNVELACAIGGPTRKTAQDAIEAWNRRKGV